MQCTNIHTFRIRQKEKKRKKKKDYIHIINHKSILFYKSVHQTDLKVEQDLELHPLRDSTRVHDPLTHPFNQPLTLRTEDSTRSIVYPHGDKLQSERPPPPDGQPGRRIRPTDRRRAWPGEQQRSQVEPNNG